MTLRPTKIETMLRIAEVVANRSTCVRTHVGCVITDEAMEQIAIGYNGGPKGGLNRCRREEPGNCGCLHAEVNAVAKVNFGGAKRAFITLSPCEACATLLVNAGVKRVFCSTMYREPGPGLAVLKEARVYFEHVVIR